MLSLRTRSKLPDSFNEAQQLGQLDLIEQGFDMLLPLRERERVAAQIQAHRVQRFGPMLRERTDWFSEEVAREERFKQKVATNRAETLFDKFAT